MPRRDRQEGEALSFAIGNLRPTQLSLFEPRAIEGFEYQPDLISREQEGALVARFSELDFKNFEFRGYLGNRRVVSFGFRYDFTDSAVHAAPEIPPFLLPLRQQAAEFARLDASALKHVLVTEYQPGAGIGWHRDRPVFQDVIGISLLSSCRFRLRRRKGEGWQREALLLEPRSAYLLRGLVREEWEHSIPSADSLRYSITFRSLKPAEA
ncbi:alpha-ketoglutarate-dependent dioxygenase AlkB [Dongia deserti]|uniref:alpha-ketoglutarate-dependent dioxygenase AlkB n=1 Tax=Dongia deserti TaxID=2268030 RepID=UPI000E64B53F|nr:alpha-ketoglutarate-dependent dioxygenase AlkB [Dongia deserti]